MNKGWSLSPAAEAELARIQALPRTSEGPIADTYDRLQGLVFLRDARVRRTVHDKRIRVYVALFQSRALALHNVAGLIKATVREFRANGRIDVAAANLLWAYKILRLAYDHSYTCRSLVPSGRPSKALIEGQCPAMSECEASLDLLQKEIAKELEYRRDEYTSAIRYGYLTNSLSQIIHAIKNLSYILNCMYRLHLRVPKPNLLKYEALRIAADSLQLNLFTYIGQFRLLHQVPELVSFEATKLVRSAAENIETGQICAAIEDLFLVNTVFPHITNALVPLIELLYPSEYYRIREHLGPTSGSHSVDLGRGLMRAEYLAFAKAYRERRTAGTSEDPQLDALLDCGVLSFRDHVSRWRELHIMLPRSILGSHATSLIGSRHASDAVAEMKLSFERSDPLQAECEGLDENRPALGGSDMPDVAAGLLALTGQITRTIFPRVEQRTGPFAPKGTRNG